MTKIMIREHNLETNEIIDREMNTQELLQYEKDQSEIRAKLAQQAEADTAKAAAQAKLAALGLTTDDLQALGL